MAGGAVETRQRRHEGAGRLTCIGVWTACAAAYISERKEKVQRRQNRSGIEEWNEGKKEREDQMETGTANLYAGIAGYPLHDLQ